MQIFEERPVWSKNALMYLTKYSSAQLKYLLPAVAYYFVTGPWRVMWVRFGYDPRLDATSLKYQTLDYRLRTVGMVTENPVSEQRSQISIQYSSCKWCIVGISNLQFFRVILRHSIYTRVRTPYWYSESTPPPLVRIVWIKEWPYQHIWKWATRQKSSFNIKFLKSTCAKIFLW